jgi:serine/threonine-protein kinase
MHRVVVLSLALACGENPSSSPDASDPRDTGIGAKDAEAMDAVLSDAGDAGTPDTGTPDASTPADAGMNDTGTTDTGTPPPSGRYFPNDAWIYQDVSAAPLHPRSGQITQWLEDNGGWGLGRLQIDFSIIVLEAGDAPYVTRDPGGDFYTPDCDDVPFPIPTIGAVEGEAGYECTMGGDCHLIVVDRRVNRLFEAYAASYAGGVFDTICIAAWDMTRTYPPEGRGEQCTSADAAGFPIAPLLFTPEEIQAGVIDHAIRFILPNARMRAGYYVRPATHAGGPSSPDMDAPTYGTRWRLRADYPVDTLPTEAAKVVARGLKQYGMALSDGGNVALTAASDQFRSVTWADVGLEPRDLDAIQPTDFEVIDTGAPIVLTYDCVRTPY